MRYRGWRRMSKDIKKMQVPKLRFPEFQNSGAWIIYPLGKCLSRHPEYGINAPAVPYSEDLPTYLRITDISDDGRIRQDQRVSVAKPVTSENYLEEGDIVLARTGASVGKAYKYRAKDGRLVFAGFLIRVRPDEEKLSSELLFQFLSTDQYWRWVDVSSARSGQPGINGNEYALLPIPLPPTFPEQLKIADCLSSLDGLISAQSQKIEALKTHKKGLMQNLFPRVGRTIPRLRFPEFRSAGEWDVSPFGEIAKFISGGTPSKDAAEYWGGDIPWISASSMHSTKIDKSDANITELAVSAGARIAKKGTLLLLVRGSMLHKRIPLGIAETDVAFNQDVKALELKANIKEQYIMYFLIASESLLLGAVTATGIGAGKLDTSDLNNFIVSVPRLAEQQKIADCLCSIDALIEANSKKLEALKFHKKGLMQSLFPVADNDNKEGF